MDRDVCIQEVVGGGHGSSEVNRAFVRMAAKELGKLTTIEETSKAWVLLELE